MDVIPTAWGRTVITPYGRARINNSGRILWAEWNVWRHSAEMVEAGLWISKVAGLAPRQHTVFYLAHVDEQ